MVHGTFGHRRQPLPGHTVHTGALCCAHPLLLGLLFVPTLVASVARWTQTPLPKSENQPEQYLLTSDRAKRAPKWQRTEAVHTVINFNTKNNCETQLRPSLSTREATATWLEHRRLSSPSHGVGGNDRQCMIIQMAASSTNGIVIRRGRRRIDSLNATNLTMNLLFTRFSQKKGPVGAQIGVGNSGKHSCRIKARAIKLSHPQTPATARKKTFWTAQKKNSAGPIPAIYAWV